MTMHTFKATGKQVLCDGVHFADAANEEASATIAAALKNAQRADDYYRNMVEMIWDERCRLNTALADHGSDSLQVIDSRCRLRSLINTLEVVESGNSWLSCEGCGKPLIDGHQTIYYEDDAIFHADCDNPFKASMDPLAHEYDNGFRPEQCQQEIELAKAALAGEFA